MTLRESTTPGANNDDGPFLDNVSLKSIGTTAVSSEMLHRADGSAFVNDMPIYFHGVNADGTYVYGIERLVDDNNASYELSENDLKFLFEQAKARCRRGRRSGRRF